MSKKPIELSEREKNLIAGLVAYWDANPDALEQFQRALFFRIGWRGRHTPPPSSSQEITVEEHIIYQDAADDWVRYCRRHLPRNGTQEALELLAIVEAGYALHIVRLLSVPTPGALTAVIYKRLAAAEEEFMPLIEALEFVHPPKRPGQS